MALANTDTVNFNAANDARFRQAPANIEAEQALLGAILVNNGQLGLIGDALRPEHFYEGVHQRIFETILKMHDKGLSATPISLKHLFDADEGMKDLGGGQYLVKLAASAIHVINVRDYADLLHDLALKRELIAIGEDTVNSAYDAKLDADANRLIETMEQKLFNLAVEGTGEKGFQQLKTSITEAILRTERAFQNSGRIVGVDTGLRDLNTLLGGMQKSDLIILAGRPSMGKTALATNIAYNAAAAFKAEADATGAPMQSVGFFSLEMSAEQLATRLLATACGFSGQKMLHGHISQDEFHVLVRESTAMGQLPFHIDDTPALSIAALRNRARRLKRTKNLGLVVVDYLQLVRPTTSRAQDSRVTEVSEITQGLKAIAKELDVPVMALSQLSRAVETREDKRPLLSDLRESGSIEQDADVVMFIYREEYYVGRSMPDMNDEQKFAKWQDAMSRVHNVAEVIIAKHRNGPIDTVKLYFDSNVTHFKDLAKER